jgi:hypothetical protein
MLAHRFNSPGCNTHWSECSACSSGAILETERIQRRVVIFYISLGNSAAFLLEEEEEIACTYTSLRMYAYYRIRYIFTEILGNASHVVIILPL